jgi:hypothetical protein
MGYTPMRCTHERDVYERHAHEMHAYERHAYERHAHKMHAYERHAHKIKARHERHAMRSTPGDSPTDPGDTSEGERMP